MKPINTTFADYEFMVKMFQNESDRGAAVLAGSYIENYLGQYLISKMTDTSVTKDIFSSEGALSSFSQRIDFAQGFGYLAKTQCDELRLIKRIRNHFAHHPTEASFNDKPVSDWVSNLTPSKTRITSLSGAMNKIDNPRLCYLVSVGILFIALNLETN